MNPSHKRANQTSAVRYYHIPSNYSQSRKNQHNTLKTDQVTTMDTKRIENIKREDLRRNVESFIPLERTVKSGEKSNVKHDGKNSNHRDTTERKQRG